MMFLLTIIDLWAYKVSYVKIHHSKKMIRKYLNLAIDKSKDIGRYEAYVTAINKDRSMGTIEVAYQCELTSQQYDC